MQAIDYIHNSDIKVHGALNTHTCLVTQQWVVRVSSFGALMAYSEHSWAHDIITLTLATD